MRAPAHRDCDHLSTGTRMPVLHVEALQQVTRMAVRPKSVMALPAPRATTRDKSSASRACTMTPPECRAPSTSRAPARTGSSTSEISSGRWLPPRRGTLRRRIRRQRDEPASRHSVPAFGSCTTAGPASRPSVAVASVEPCPRRSTSDECARRSANQITDDGACSARYDQDRFICSGASAHFRSHPKAPRSLPRRRSPAAPLHEPRHTGSSRSDRKKLYAKPTDGKAINGRRCHRQERTSTQIPRKDIRPEQMDAGHHGTARARLRRAPRRDHDHPGSGRRQRQHGSSRSCTRPG